MKPVCSSDFPLRIVRTAGASALALLFCMPTAWAAAVAVQVTDAAGQAVADAVVYAEMDGQAAATKPLAVVQIEQKNRKFDPLVTVIQTGTQISFPNNDTVRHHIYSFSAAKKFEQKLYSGTAASLVTFDKHGTVALGCNIHDKMIAYVHVVDTPYFGKTDAAGKLKLDGLPPGKYVLKAWHFNLFPGAAIPEQALSVNNEVPHATFKLTLKPVVAPAPTESKSSYFPDFK